MKGSSRVLITMAAAMVMTTAGAMLASAADSGTTAPQYAQYPWSAGPYAAPAGQGYPYRYNGPTPYYSPYPGGYGAGQRNSGSSVSTPAAPATPATIPAAAVTAPTTPATPAVAAPAAPVMPDPLQIQRDLVEQRRTAMDQQYQWYRKLMEEQFQTYRGAVLQSMGNNPDKDKMVERLDQVHQRMMASRDAVHKMRMGLLVSPISANSPEEFMAEKKKMHEQVMANYQELQDTLAQLSGPQGQKLRQLDKTQQELHDHIMKLRDQLDQQLNEEQRKLQQKMVGDLQKLREMMTQNPAEPGKLSELQNQLHKDMMADQDRYQQMLTDGQRKLSDEIRDADRKLRELMIANQ